MDGRVAVALRGRSHEKLRAVALGVLQAVVGAERSYLHRCDAMFCVVDRTRRRGEIEDVADRTKVEGLRYIVALKRKARFAGEMRDVFLAASEKIVEAQYRMAFGQKRIAQVRAQKPGAAGHQRPHHRA